MRGVDADVGVHIVSDGQLPAAGVDRLEAEVGQQGRGHRVVRAGGVQERLRRVREPVGELLLQERAQLIGGMNFLVRRVHLRELGGRVLPGLNPLGLGGDIFLDHLLAPFAGASVFIRRGGFRICG